MALASGVWPHNRTRLCHTPAAVPQLFQLADQAPLLRSLWRRGRQPERRPQLLVHYPKQRVKKASERLFFIAVSQRVRFVFKRHLLDPIAPSDGDTILTDRYCHMNYGPID
jgi:hypothetical protein